VLILGWARLLNLCRSKYELVPGEQAANCCLIQIFGMGPGSSNKFFPKTVDYW
jgi:hypothetical protein